MTVQHPHAELSAFIDNALDPAAQAAVEGHVVACVVCRAHVAELRAAATLVQALTDPVPSRRLVPRLAVPAWLAPVRTLMTLATGAAVFLFIASSLVSNITFLAGSGTTALTSREASGDSAANAQAPKVPQPASTALPVPAASPGEAFSAFSPTASATVDARKSAERGATPSDVKQRTDLSSAAPSGAPDVAAAPQEAGRFGASAPQSSPLLNPWLWLAVAIVCGAVAVALHRRLRVSV